MKTKDLPCLFLAASAWIVATALLATSANSQELPAEGKFSITYTAINPSPAKPIAISPTKDIVMNNYIMTASNDAGSGLLHGLAGRCASVATIDKAAKTVESRTLCNYADRNGDMIFEEVNTPGPQPLGPVVNSKAHWTGGTGKYAGLTGEFDVRNEAVLATEGLVQAVGKKTGSYKIAP
jgi:hypothetical protein